MTEEFRIITKDELKAKSNVKMITLPLPELGEGVAVRVKEFTVGDKLEIQSMVITYDSEGKVAGYDKKQDVLMSFVKALDEPKLNPIIDGEWIMSLADEVVQRVISAAQGLNPDYEAMKAAMKINPYLRRIYSVCVNKLGRLPSELKDIPEAEFKMALAALELDQEDEEAALEALKS